MVDAAFPSADNVPSIRLLERNGFKREDDGQEREGNLVRFILSEFIERVELRLSSAPVRSPNA
jgi:RimJ/RimL family protein N-acetyltransferase